ncbi:MAG: hypothetical protein EOO75_02875 [Myxococcales bacterium]|nr:MAG: hypothetical protein EOO75_02875 [Myxococcales bacterium]
MALTLLKNGTKSADVILRGSPREAEGGRGRCVIAGTKGDFEEGATYTLDDGQGHTIEVRADMTHEKSAAGDEPTATITFDWSKPFAWAPPSQTLAVAPPRPGRRERRATHGAGAMAGGQVCP